MRDNIDVFEMRDPQDTVGHLVVNYTNSWKAMEEAREMGPYTHSKISSIDYHF
jgi:hypothetical protein